MITVEYRVTLTLNEKMVQHHVDHHGKTMDQLLVALEDGLDAGVRSKDYVFGIQTERVGVATDAVSG